MTLALGHDAHAPLRHAERAGGESLLRRPEDARWGLDPIQFRRRLEACAAKPSAQAKQTGKTEDGTVTLEH